MTRKVQIYGERWSGTNFLEHLLKRNIEDVEITWDHGWKHWFPKPTAAQDTETLFFVIYRNVFDWLQSMLKYPDHAAPHLKQMCFSEFIRAEWVCVHDQDASLEPHAAGFGTEMLCERDPSTGTRFANILKLRTAKIQVLEQLRQSISTIHYLRHEELMASREEFLQQVSRTYGMDLRSPIDPVHENRGYLSTPCVLPPPSPISAEDREFILEKISLPVEHSIGYDYDVDVLAKSA